MSLNRGSLDKGLSELKVKTLKDESGNIIFDVSALAPEIDDLTSAEINQLKNIGAAVLSAEWGFLDGLTSDLQTQLDGKQANIGAITASAAEINKLDGLLPSQAELDHIDGATENIQTAITLLKALAALGVANKFVYPTTYGGSNSAVMTIYRSRDTYRNVGASVNIEHTFDCMIPTNLGGKKLYLDGGYAKVQEADADDHIDLVKVVGQKDATYTDLLTIAGNLDSDGEEAEVTGEAIDCSAFDLISAIVICDTNTLGDLKFYPILLYLYYDT